MGSFMADKNFIAKRLEYISQLPKKASMPFIAVLALLLCVLVSVCILGFTATAQNAQSVLPLQGLDIGEPAQQVQRLFPSSDINIHNLAEQGAQIFEQQLYPNVVNYIPVELSTDTTNMWITILASDCSVLVYIYNAADKDYPLMQMILENDSVPQAFSGLSRDDSYVLGILIDHSVGKPTRFLVSDQPS